MYVYGKIIKKRKELTNMKFSVVYLGSFQGTSLVGTSEFMILLLYVKWTKEQTHKYTPKYLEGCTPFVNSS